MTSIGDRQKSNTSSKNPEDKAEIEKQQKKRLVSKNIIFGTLLAFALTAISIYSALSIGNEACDKNSTPVSGEIRDKSPFIKDLELCGLNDIKLWKTLVVIMSAGATGGLVFELLNLKGNIEWPHGPTKDELAAKFAYATPENLYDLGYLARLLIGALSAPVTIAVVPQSSVLAMLATSVVAGSSGALIFRALQDRLTAAIYNKQLDDEHKADKTQEQHLKRAAELITDKLDEAIKAFNTLSHKIGTDSNTSSGKLTFPSDPELKLVCDDFRNVWTPLNEAEVVAELIETQTDDSKKLQQSVNDVIDAFAKLQQAVDEVSESRQGEPEITLIPGETLDLEYFRKIQQLLNEAKASTDSTEKILTADNGTTD
jgi:hypothetical protein